MITAGKPEKKKKKNRHLRVEKKRAVRSAFYGGQANAGGRGAAQEEMKKRKAKNHATRSDFTLDSSAIESRDCATRRRRCSRADLKSVERQTKGKLKK